VRIVVAVISSWFVTAFLGALIFRQPVPVALSYAIVISSVMGFGAFLIVKMLSGIRV
jgi:hypothetical protein